MLSIYGAGSVGLVVGAHLARAGEPVLFITRTRAAAECIEREGVRFEDPAESRSFVAPAAAVAGIGAAAGRIGDGPVLFCMRGGDVPDAARALAGVAPAVPVAGLQNDVHHEALLAERFASVTGVVVRQTCTWTAPNAAVAAGRPRLVVGAHPEGRAAHADALAARLGRAGFEVGISERIAEDKWLKLCVNLMSAPNALVRREDHESQTFVEIKVRLLEEARDALSAAGVLARSCDGSDRSLDDEIAWQRGALARGTSARRLPVYNQVWGALTHGGCLEADGYHRRIGDLARRHGLDAPMNARVLAALERAHAGRRGPECLAAGELLGEDVA